MGTDMVTQYDAETLEGLLMDSSKGSYLGEPTEPEAILRYFKFSHLPAKLAAVSEHFARLAWYVVTAVPRSAERTVALRKLLESKDAAVRAALP